MKLSIVTTLYQSAPYINEFHERATTTAKQLVGDDYEIVLVNDGSPDNSLELAMALRELNTSVRIVDLSRNFGHHPAIIAGLAHSRGERVLLMDCDLEEQPEWLVDFVQKMESSGADVVFGVQEARVASPLSNLLGGLFWRALNSMSMVRIPNNPMTCRLMTRRYVNALLEVEDRVLYLAGTFAWTGYRQESIPFRKVPRPVCHRSSYRIGHKLMQVVDSFSSFSVAPLTAIFMLGFTIWCGSIAVGVLLMIKKLIQPEMILSGFTSLMISLWFLGGSIILGIGIIGLYIGKVFQECKRRPLYIVRQVYGDHDGKSA